MTQHRIRLNMVLLAVLAGALSLAGCAKKSATVTPPPPPSPAQSVPTATISANPNVLQQGQASTLTWQTDHANEVTIEGLGAVPAFGSRSVSPGASTTYTLVAQGPGGKEEAVARITVNPASAGAAPSLSDEDLFSKNVKDVFFDYDRYVIRPADKRTVKNDQSFLEQHPSIKVLVEGHCDDRGSEEYNIALGASRAESAKQALVQEGIPADRIKTVSYGKEKPFCTEDDEQCWQLNRVDHFVYAH
jgi:peptidoglycan-associated lipoprotein